MWLINWNYLLAILSTPIFHISKLRKAQVLSPNFIGTMEWPLQPARSYQPENRTIVVKFSLNGQAYQTLTQRGSHWKLFMFNSPISTLGTRWLLMRGERIQSLFVYMRDARNKVTSGPLNRFKGIKSRPKSPHEHNYRFKTGTLDMK